MPRDGSLLSLKHSVCMIYSLDCVRRWRRQSFARKLERNLSRRDIGSGRRLFGRSLHSISRSKDDQVRAYRGFLLLYRPKNPLSPCLPCGAVSCGQLSPCPGSRSCCSCASDPSATRSLCAMVSTSWSRVDLPETEDGMELTVLPVSECFKELIRPGDCKGKVILR